MRRPGLAGGWDWEVCLTLRDVRRVPVVPAQPLPRLPNSLGRPERWAGQLVFLLGPVWGRPWAGPATAARRKAEPAAGHVLVGRPRLTLPVRRARGGGGRPHSLRRPLSSPHTRARDPGHGRRSRPLRGLLAEGTRTPAAEREDSTAPSGTASPSLGTGLLLHSRALNYSRRGQFQIIIFSLMEFTLICI